MSRNIVNFVYIIFLFIVIALTISFFMKKYVISLVLVLVIVSLVSYYFGVYSYTNKIFPFGINKHTVEKSNLDTAYYDLAISKYNLPKYSTYGGIDFLNDQLLFMSGSKEMYFLNLPPIGLH